MMKSAWKLSHAMPLPLAPSEYRYDGTMLTMQALGTQCNWTLNQEIVFSSALTGQPVRKEEFAHYCWKRCVIGTQSDYAMALFRDEWEHALQRRDRRMLKDAYDNPSVFCPANNTEYLNVAAYLEALWVYLWPTLSHNHEPLVENGQRRSMVV